MNTHEIHPAEPGAYWARSKDEDEYTVIAFVDGRLPFFTVQAIYMTTLTELRRCDRAELIYGPRIEQPFVDETAAVEGGAM